MASCPNVNLQSWKDLVAKIGTYEAMREFIRNDGQIPEASSYPQTLQGVNATFKIVQALSNPKIETFFKSQYLKGNKEKFYTEVAALSGKQQTALLREWNEKNNPQSLQEMVAGVLAELSYTVEVKTAVQDGFNTNYGGISIYKTEDYDGNVKWAITDEETGTELAWYDSKEEAEKHAGKGEMIPTSHYSNLTVPGGTNYIENEISTPLITPSIKGHAQFATDNGIGWHRSDEQITYSTEDIDTIINTLESSKQLIIKCD